MNYLSCISRTLQDLHWTTCKNRKQHWLRRRASSKVIASRPSQQAHRRKLEKYLRRSQDGS